MGQMEARQSSLSVPHNSLSQQRGNERCIKTPSVDFVSVPKRVFLPELAFFCIHEIINNYHLLMHKILYSVFLDQPGDVLRGEPVSGVHISVELSTPEPSVSLHLVPRHEPPWASQPSLFITASKTSLSVVEQKLEGVVGNIPSFLPSWRCGFA